VFEQRKWTFRAAREANHKHALACVTCDDAATAMRATSDHASSFQALMPMKRGRNQLIQASEAEAAVWRPLDCHFRAERPLAETWPLA
jgi:hypothetical protein